MIGGRREDEASKIGFCYRVELRIVIIVYEKLIVDEYRFARFE